MSLIKPKHIADAAISSRIVRYKWDDWDIKSAYMPADDALLARLAPLSLRAKTALTIAQAEWVVFRFETLSDDRLPYDYLEAAWAGNVDWRYVHYIETEDSEWMGPVRGPLDLAVTIVVDILFCSERSAEPALNAAWMSTLAELVLPDVTAFHAWREQAVRRLETFFPAPPEDPDDLFGDLDTGGDLVPPQVFDPGFEFTPTMTRGLVASYLATLDYRANPFLQSPEEMIEAGFEGVPYALREGAGE